MDDIAYSEMHRPSYASPSSFGEPDSDGMADVDEESETNGVNRLFAQPSPSKPRNLIKDNNQKMYHINKDDKLRISLPKLARNVEGAS